MKILVIGSPGSGKTTFTIKISKYLGLPVFHLDDLYWLKGWSRPSEKEWLEKLNQLVNNNNWIIDGNYYNSLDIRFGQADYVIYLDYPITLCLFRAFKRTLNRRLFKLELPLQIKQDSSYTPSIKFNIKFIKLIITFKYKYKATIMKMLGSYKLDSKILKSPKEAEKFLQDLAEKHHI
ncbi:MAG: hypothetical protein ACK5WP_09485 [Neisseriaceae bacterium]|jgi:adenylate kinase family enzyme